MQEAHEKSTPFASLRSYFLRDLLSQEKRELSSVRSKSKGSSERFNWRGISKWADGEMLERGMSLEGEFRGLQKVPQVKLQAEGRSVGVVEGDEEYFELACEAR